MAHILKAIQFVHHDGGRALSGFKGSAHDCVTRSIAIATGLPYTQVYMELLTKQSALPKSGPKNSAYTSTKAKIDGLDRSALERSSQSILLLRLN